MQKRNCILMAGAIVLAGLLLFTTLSRGPALETGSWGLSFSQDGESPRGNASPEALAAYDAAFLGDTSEKVIYLTFDAGYENGSTARILDALQKHKVQAAFFLVGNYIERNPELVRRMVAEGHTVGNHTMHHYDMSKLSDFDAFSKELSDLADLFRETTGQELPRYYRPPQGIYSEENLKNAQKLGYKTVFWSLAYVDWNNDSQPTKEAAFAKLLPRIHLPDQRGDPG